MKKQETPVATKKATTKQGATTAKKLQESAEKKMKEAQEKQAALVEAIKMYQQDIDINANIVNDCLTNEQKKCVKALDDAMCPLSDMVLTRVTIKAILDEYKKQLNVENIAELNGKTITNVPFMSTTKKDYKEVIKRRYDMGVGQPVCILIHTNKDVKGIDVDAEIGTSDFNKQEIILARNQQFLIKKIEIGEGCGETYPIIELYPI